MNKALKNSLKIIIIVIAAISLLTAIFFLLGFSMVRNIDAAYQNIASPNLESIPDGIYRGSAGEFIISVDLDVTVKNHLITAVDIQRQICSSKHKALDTIRKIIENQAPKVDIVSGATYSSKSIMAAVYKALSKTG